MSKLFDWLNTPKVKPSAFLAVILGILYFIFTSTSIFQDLPEIWQTLIYIGIIVFSTLIGVSITSLKQFSNELNEIIKNAKLNPEQKVNELTALAIKVNTQLGLAWESYNINVPADSETADNADEIAKLTAKLEELENEIKKTEE
jgi:L-cystine uptake protein TcyP (sodium:dicarboxylate symporter family)